ncbi:fibrinogen-like protein 1-like protein [Pristis pectinata]|uniref:fibrinogen-like protein 1-like protein n=1 Tax=Pristis pectinata TaxID=685728 RepID=UPI00223CADD9|nr:fibrinogen-like protein 1-like protein [Pristis pectinata]XP_051891834.1 fibrinogen-like protein 1-like protein [Pristis pectinata]
MEQRIFFQTSLLLLLIAATISAIPRDCTEIESENKRAGTGLYVIQPTGSPPLVVNCIRRGNSSWTVIQRNSRLSKITWTESWTTYKYGFGDVLGDHWLGNEYIYLLTKQKMYKLRIEIKDNKNVVKFAEYSSFYIESESSRYTIRLGPFQGTAPDCMTNTVKNQIIDNQRFSTRDCDYDNYRISCAASRGGWWHDACGYSYLNHKYPQWNSLHVVKVSMMIQPVC